MDKCITIIYIYLTKQKKTMKTKHTQGEWKIETDNSYYGEWYNVGPARIDFGYNVTTEEFEEVKANAKLIAAAPKLLKCLSEIVRYHNDDKFMVHCDEACDEGTSGNVTAMERFLWISEEAIKKAT